MPHYIATLDIACPLADLFTFLAAPKNLVQLAPADLHLELLAGPQTLEAGARLTWKSRRWGFTQHIVQEVTAFELDRRIVVEQRQGPFARWVHAHRFDAIEIGTRLIEQIDFEAPGGLLGRLVSADLVRKELDALYAQRTRRIKELLEAER